MVLFHRQDSGDAVAFGVTGRNTISERPSWHPTNQNPLIQSHVLVPSAFANHVIVTNNLRIHIKLLESQSLICLSVAVLSSTPNNKVSYHVSQTSWLQLHTILRLCMQLSITDAQLLLLSNFSLQLLMPCSYSRPFATIEELYKYKLLNTPDKTILGFKVHFAPNASTPPHTHAGAFVAVCITKYVLYNLSFKRRF
jgi:hypothetical protein